MSQLDKIIKPKLDLLEFPKILHPYDSDLDSDLDSIRNSCGVFNIV